MALCIINISNITDLTGEYESRNFEVSRGDSRVAITIAKNAETSRLGRTTRFLIDDPASPVKLAYTLSKPLKFNGIYNGEGVFKWVKRHAAHACQMIPFTARCSKK